MLSDSFFHPNSIAIVGASEAPGRIGSGLVETMLKSGLELFPVNPKHAELFSRRCHRSIAELPQVPSHVFIAVQRDLVLPCLRECAALGIKNVVIISSGFKEKDASGALLENEIQKIASAGSMTVLGPNTLGFISTDVGFNGTFLPAEVPRGPVSVISQSGGVGMALLSALADQRCGVSKWIGIGNEAGVTALDALEYLAGDPMTKAIAVCMEGLRDLAAFLQRASDISKTKPIVLLRDGKSSVGLRAAASHTGAMVYEGTVLPSLFRQYHLPEASSTRDCAAMLKALCIAPRAAGNRAVLLTNTAGPSVLAADVMEALGVSLPPVPEELSHAIDEEAGVEMSLRNPADISSNGLSPRNYGIAATSLLCSDQYDLLLGFFSLNPHLKLPEHELIDASHAAGKPAVACFLSSQKDFLSYSIETLEQAGIPCFCDPHDAAIACAAILAYRKPSRSSASSASPPDAESDRSIAAFLDSCTKGLLSERNSKKLLSLTGVKVFVPLLATDPDEAVEAADNCGFPVALKLESDRITHKSAVGGVRLYLDSQRSVREAAHEMLPRLRALDPDAALTVQPMCDDGFELILGAVRSPLGVLLMVGMGGRYAELLADNAFCLLPASREALREALLSLHCSRVLYDSTGVPKYDEESLLNLLGIICSMMERFPRISELEINPCRLTGDGLGILDARTVLSPLKI